MEGMIRDGIRVLIVDDDGEIRDSLAAALAKRGYHVESAHSGHEAMLLIAEGHTTKEIAVRLHVSIKTVETHRTQLMQRLDIHDIAGLVRYAMRTGLLAPDA